MRRLRTAALLAASIAYTAAADAGPGADYGGGSYDYGPNFDDVHWSDGATGHDDLLRGDRDIDTDFEADDILALNLSHAEERGAQKLGFRIQRKALKHLDVWLYRLR